MMLVRYTKNGISSNPTGVSISMEMHQVCLSTNLNTNRSNPYVTGSKENKDDSDRISQEKDLISQVGPSSHQTPTFAPMKSSSHNTCPKL